jgi:dTMP kinase
VVGKSGRFITFEGTDGSGKSTQIEKLAGALRSLRFEVLLTREPGGTPIGESIRHTLLDSSTHGLCPLTELALMFAARVQHLHEVILPALDPGHYVLCDRFTDSTEAYQGGGRKLGSEVVLELHRILCDNIQPDLTILLDCDLTVSLTRAKHRNLVTSGAGYADENRFEQENRDFFGRVHETFLAIAAREPKRVALIDARGTPAETHAKVLDVVRDRLHLPAI